MKKLLVVLLCAFLLAQSLCAVAEMLEIELEPEIAADATEYPDEAVSEDLDLPVAEEEFELGLDGILGEEPAPEQESAETDCDVMATEDGFDISRRFETSNENRLRDTRP